MKIWIAGTRATSEHGEDTFIFGAFATEKEARAAAERHTYHEHAVPLLYECELGAVDSAGIPDSYEAVDAE